MTTTLPLRSARDRCPLALATAGTEKSGAGLPTRPPPLPEGESEPSEPEAPPPQPRAVIAIAAEKKNPRTMPVAMCTSLARRFSGGGVGVHGSPLPDGRGTDRSLRSRWEELALVFGLAGLFPAGDAGGHDVD